MWEVLVYYLFDRFKSTLVRDRVMMLIYLDGMTKDHGSICWRQVFFYQSRNECNTESKIVDFFNIVPVTGTLQMQVIRSL